MERIRHNIITIVCVMLCEHQRIFGTEVNIRVNAGDNITLFSDCDAPIGSHIFWIRNNSYGNQSSLSLNAEDIFTEKFPRLNFVVNSSSGSFDLHIKNTSVYDEGVYYCAKVERKITTDVNGKLNYKYEYQYGNRRSLLIVLDPVSANAEPTSPPVPDTMITWTLLFSVCPVCVLLCSICVYCLCRPKKTTGSEAETQTKNRYDEGEEVYYASLNKSFIQQKQQKNKRSRDSDFSTYSEVRMKRTDC